MKQFGGHTMKFRKRITKSTSHSILGKMSRDPDLIVCGKWEGGRPVGKRIGYYRYFTIRYREYHGISFILRILEKRPPWFGKYQAAGELITVGQKTHLADDTGFGIPGSLICCDLFAIINPAILLGSNSWVEITSFADVENLIHAFDREMMRISLDVGSLRDWIPVRVDYCVNIDPDRLGVYGETRYGGRCVVPPELLMWLIRRSRVHWKYKWDDESLAGNNMFLMNDSVHVNIYCKGEELKRNHPDKWMDEYDRVLRVEIQLLEPKMFEMRKSYEDWTDMLRDDICLGIVGRYLRRICGTGNWYSLAQAKKIVKTQHFHKNKEDYLMYLLLVVARDGFEGFRMKLSGRQEEKLYRGVRVLEGIGVNIVTIPAARGIRKIVNPVNVLLPK